LTFFNDFKLIMQNTAYVTVLSTCQISESVQPGEKPATSAKERTILPRDIESPPYIA
jgi:hypothetical protein